MVTTGLAPRSATAEPPQAALSWTRTVGLHTSPNDVVLTLLGDVFVVGTTTDNLDGTHAGNTAGDAVIARFDRNGKRKWLRQFSSPGDHADSATSISLSGNGDLYIAGSTAGDVDGLHADVASTDGFVARYDRDGRRQWIVQYGTEADDVANADVVTSVGDIFVAGATRGNLDGGHGSTVDWDAYVMRLDRTGATKWVRQYASTGPGGDEAARALAADSSGAVVITGSTSGNLDGNHPAVASEDAFVLRLDRTGKRNWTEQIASHDGGNERINGVTLVGNPPHAILVAGDTNGDVDGDHPGGGAAHGTDAFVARIDGDGNGEWATQLGSSGDDTLDDLVVASGSIVASGSTAGDLDGAHPSTTTNDRLLVRLSTDGVERWIGQRHVDSAAGTNTALASNPSGDIVVLSETTAVDPSLEGFVSRYRKESLTTWLDQHGTTGDDAVNATALAADGDVVTAGSTTANLDGNHPSNTSLDGVVERYGVEGDRKWAVQIGQDATDETLTGVATNWRGDIFVVGRTTGDLDALHPDAAGGDAFLARLDSSGTVVWVRQLGTADNDSALAVTAIAAGDVFVAGLTTGDLDGSHAGNTSMDGFIARFDRAGNLKWTRQVGDAGTEDALTAVGASLRGDVVAGGYTFANLDGKHASSSASDALLVRFDRAGHRRWLRQFGSAAPATDDMVAAVAVDIKGEIFVSGATLGDIDGKHAGNTSADVIVARYAPSGSREWLRQWGTAGGGNESGAALTATPSGEVYVTGSTDGSVDGEPPVARSRDALLLRYTRRGIRVLRAQYGGAGNDDARGIAVSRRGTVYLGGATDGRLGESTAGALDAFLTRLPA